MTCMLIIVLVESLLHKIEIPFYMCVQVLAVLPPEQTLKLFSNQMAANNYRLVQLSSDRQELLPFRMRHRQPAIA